MSRAIRIPAAEISNFAHHAFDQGQSVRITVTGSSMQPFLRPLIDSVELEQTDLSTIRTGDIVLFRRRSGAYVLHRLYRKSQGQYYFVGDAQTFVEGPVEANQIVARVTTIWRGQKRIPASNPALRLAVSVWTHTIFLRKVVNYIRRQIAAARTN